MSPDTPAMTDAELADVQARHDAYKRSHDHMNAFACCTAHASADDVPGLLAEVKRLRTDNGILRAMQDSYIVALDQVSIGDMQRLVAERDQAREERDLAIAHDRQPYPTAWAYEQACAALNKQRERAETAEARLAEIGETREEWGFGDHPDRVTVPLAQGYRNGTPRQWAEDGAQRNHVKVWTRSVGPWREVNEEAGRG